MIRSVRTVVTGGSSGLGLTLVDRLDRDGLGPTCSVARRTSRPADVSCDLSDLDSLEQGLRGDLGKVLEDADILINNAAGDSGLGWEDVTPQDLLEQYRLIIVANLMLSRRFLSTAGSDRPKRIVNIGSLATLRPRARVGVAYRLAKASLQHLTEVQSLMAAPHSSANLVISGPFASAIGRVDDGTYVQATVEGETPFGRYGSTVEVADLIIAMLKQSIFITGSTFKIDGGLSL